MFELALEGHTEFQVQRFNRSAIVAVNDSRLWLSCDKSILRRLDSYLSRFIFGFFKSQEEWQKFK